MPTNASRQPWLARKDWAAGRVAGANPFLGCIVIWIFALIWCGLSGVASWSILSHHMDAIHHQGPMPIPLQGLFAIGFPIIALGLLGLAIRTTARALRFGRSTLTLDAVPVVPGGTLSGCIDCAVESQLEPSFDLTVSCNYKWYSGVGKNTESHTEVLWSDEYECTGERSAALADGSSIPVRFSLPGAAVPTGPYQRGTVSWNLKAASSLPGLDFEDDFDLPVFPGDPAESTTVREPRRPPQVKRHPVHAQVQLSSEGSDLQLVFPPAM